MMLPHNQRTDQMPVASDSGRLYYSTCVLYCQWARPALACHDGRPAV